MPIGPCVMCGATNYPLSMGGPGICPSCDCGASQSPKHHRQLQEALDRANEHISELEQGKMGDPATWVCPFSGCRGVQYSLQLQESLDQARERIRELEVELSQAKELQSLLYV